MLPFYQENNFHFNSLAIIFSFVLTVSFMAKGIAAADYESHFAITKNVSSATNVVSPSKNISTTTPVTFSKKANAFSTTDTPNAHTTAEDSSTMIIIILVAVTFLLVGVSIIIYCLFCGSNSDTDMASERKSRGRGSKTKAKALSTKTKKLPQHNMKSTYNSGIQSKESPLPSINCKSDKVTTTVPDKPLKSKVAGEGTGVGGGGGGAVAVTGSQILLGSILPSTPATQNVGGAAVVKSQADAVKSTVAAKSKLDGKRKMSSIEKSLLKAKNALKSTTSNAKSNRSTGFYVPASSFQNTR